METTSNEVALKRVVLTETGLELPPAITFDEWQAAGRELWYRASRCMFLLGDWLILGEERFGEKYAQALEGTGYALKTLQNAAYVCKKVDPTIRRPGELSFGHHKAIAGLPPDEQFSMIQRAIDEDMTVRELEFIIAAGKAGGSEQTEQAYKPDAKKGLQEIVDQLDKVKMSAVPTTKEIQKMMLCHQKIRVICREHGID